MVANLKYTSIDEIPSIRDGLRKTFSAGLVRSIPWRRHQLLQLARMVQENKDAFVKAIYEDIGKPAQEVYFVEVGSIVQRSLASAEKLEEWTKPESVEVPDWQKPWNPTLHKTPKGTVLIIAPWNYPLILSLQPLIGAIAAGCTAIVKPSELAPAFAQLLTDLFPKYLESSAFRVVNGAVKETTKLLDLQWEHIFYTGNGRVARIVAAAAAKHLTPTTLELGGKSPVIIDPSFDIKLAAKRVLWGKINNAGQICVAPDYVLVTKDKQDEFIAALKEHYEAWYPDGALKDPSYGRIATPAHFNRLSSLLARSKGKVAFGGQTEGPVFFEPTIVRDVKGDDSLMEEELFGPILPIIPVESIDEAIAFVNARSHPLVSYPFTDDAKLKARFVNETNSGNLAFNDVFMQMAVSEIPFGGIGESGSGYQNLKYTFDNFTHIRGTVDIPAQAEPFLQARYPPYINGSDNFKAMTAAMNLPIPKSA